MAIHLDPATAKVCLLPHLTMGSDVFQLQYTEKSHTVRHRLTAPV